MHHSFCNFRLLNSYLFFVVLHDCWVNAWGGGLYLKNDLKEWLKGKEFGAGVAEGSKLGCFGHLWLEKRGMFGDRHIQSPTLALQSAEMLPPYWDSSSSSSQALFFSYLKKYGLLRWGLQRGSFSGLFLRSANNFHSAGATFVNCWL